MSRAHSPEEAVPTHESKDALMETESVAERGREHHLRRDQQTGMRKKELLYLPEGIEYLNEKFQGQASFIFTDVTGVGVGNELLCRPGEGGQNPREIVDRCFSLLTEVTTEVCEQHEPPLPFEIIRLGGDEIAFLLGTDADLLPQILSAYNTKKTEYLREVVGTAVYDQAKTETNRKAQMKRITKSDAFQRNVSEGDVTVLDAWLRSEIGDGAEAERRTGDLLRTYAEKQLKDRDPNTLLEPLDLYQSRVSSLTFSLDTEESRRTIMTALSRGDADIAWTKSHPGEPFPENVEDSTAITETTEKYLTQSREVEATVRSIQQKEHALILARELHQTVEIERLKKEIIRLETRDPGTGGIRLSDAEHRLFSELVEIGGTDPLQIVHIDIPYFGVFNNQYDYATADEMMMQLTQIMRQQTHGTMIRDGGNLYSVCSPATKFDQDELLEKLQSTIRPYALPSDSTKARSIQNEVLIKQTLSRQSDQIGSVRCITSIPDTPTDTTTLGEFLLKH